MAIVVMGVSGAGKSTIAAALAREIGGVFLDADDLHPASNVAKMASGTPLTDDDRMPWLALCGETLATSTARGELPVLACSALRRSYRDAIRAAAPDAFFVLLHGTHDLLSARIGARTDHFMPAALLTSQLATLEQLGPDEHGAVVSIEGTPDDIVAAAEAAWRAASITKE